MDPGTRLGPYEIKEPLGKGGMGEVYRAHDGNLRRDVAIKLLPEELADDPERLARLEREARSLASLNHPHIATVHGFEEQDGTRFIVMELVEGETLAEKLEELAPVGGMELEDFFEIAAPLADALSAAHGRGVVHRDLKPANVMVSGEGRVKVLDFGVAKLAEAPTGDLTKVPTETVEALTREGRVVGTVPYMSPEQLRGRPADARSDLFSLGILLYEMATGQQPFRGESSAEVLSSVLRDEPLPAIELRPELPRDLSRILRRCLAKDPERRFQTAKDVRNELQDLERELTAEEVLAGAPDAASERRLGGPGWLAAGLVGAAALGLMLWLAIPSLQGPAGTETTQKAVAPAADRKMILVLPFENLGPAEDEYFAAGITEELTSRLGMVEGLGVISRTSAVQYDRAGKGIREIGEEFGVGYVLEGTVRWAREGEGPSRVRITPQLIRVADDTHLWADAYDRVIEDIFEVQSDIAANVIDELELTLVGGERRAVEEARPTENLDAYNAYLQGLYYRERADFGPEEARRAVEAFERAVDLDPEFALAHVQLSRARSLLYLFGTERTPDNAARARAAVERARELEPDLPQVHLALGHYHYMVERDYGPALQQYRAAAEGLPSSAESLHWIAMILRRQGRWEESISTHEEALRLDPRAVFMASQLAQTYFRMRRFERTLELLERTLSLEPDHEGALGTIAAVHLAWKGDVSATRAAAERIPGETVHKLYWLVIANLVEGREEDALARLEAFPEDDFHYDTNFHGPKGIATGWVLDRLGRRDEARDAYRSALDALLGQEQARAADPNLHSALGLAYAGLDRKTEAIRHGRRAVELMPVERDAVVGVDYMEALAWIYAQVGEPGPALDLLEELLAMPSDVTIPFLETYPLFEPLREHPRFRELVGREGPA